MASLLGLCGPRTLAGDVASLDSSLPLPPASERSTDVSRPLVRSREMGQSRELVFERDGCLLA